jgi:hypothetical protein
VDNGLVGKRHDAPGIHLLLALYLGVGFHHHFGCRECDWRLVLAQDRFSVAVLFLSKKTPVEKLRIAQGPVKPLPVSGAKPRPRGRAVLPPLPAATEAELNASVEAAPDSLKAALGKLGRAVLSQPPRDEGR